ncbi:MAG: hypothetical protein ACLTSZ_06730 [Lachnospiraceae bacterium]
MRSCKKQILDCALAMLRPGGMLLYSTCTFAKEGMRTSSQMH